MKYFSLSKTFFYYLFEKDLNRPFTSNSICAHWTVIDKPCHFLFSNGNAPPQQNMDQTINSDHFTREHYFIFYGVNPTDSLIVLLKIQLIWPIKIPRVSAKSLAKKIFNFQNLNLRHLIKRTEPLANIDTREHYYIHL